MALALSSLVAGPTEQEVFKRSNRQAEQLSRRDENSALFFGMANTAIQTGRVDFVLAPGMIAQELIRISRDGDPKGSGESVLPNENTVRNRKGGSEYTSESEFL